MSRCAFNLPLVISLRNDGYREFEWFCKSFSPQGKVHAAALQEFESIRNDLAPDVLYRGYSGDGSLVEIPFTSLVEGKSS